MNSKLAFLFARRSIRAYTDAPVSDETVRDLLEGAMAAPSACAADPWRFTVVRDRQVLRELAAGLPNGKMLADAAVGIVVCGDIEAAHDKRLSYMIQDCSAAIENLLLSATALGLGACWLGVHPREERIAHVRAVLDAPAAHIPIGAVAIGHPAQASAPRTRYDEAKVDWR